jgi:UDP-GlcNAc:undecaprenyl-phosphate/decaprenyl-phosphate GlcNAc-1-phosphate transferase
MDFKAFITNYWFIFAGVFVSTFVGFWALTVLPKMKPNIFKRMFHIPARKSVTNAVQLGGLPLSIGIFLGILSLLYVPDPNHIFGVHDLRFVKYWLISGSFIILYGYLDDKFELRPIVKLTTQLVSVFIFAFYTSWSFHNYYSSAAFIICSIWGLGVLNGSNLLDGLDTLTVKIGLVTYAIIGAMGTYYGSGATIIGTGICASALISFYFFNKEPAKIHLGEIGGSFIGFSYLLLCSFLYLKIKTTHQVFHATFVTLSLLSLPMVELGVSFLRRIFNRRSPFSGDRLHIHHILRNFHNFSASGTASVMAFSYTLVCLSTFGLAVFEFPLATFLVTVFLEISIYVAVGAKYWIGHDTINFHPKALFNYLRKKDIMIIDSSKIDDFHITILQEDEEDDMEEDENNDKYAS